MDVMRYSVTVKQPAAFVAYAWRDDPLSDPVVLSRRTGLTLDEAMDTIRPYCESGTNLWDLGAPTEGGTVGPLPDGTVIVVERERGSWEEQGESLIERPPWIVYQTDLARLHNYGVAHRLGDSATAIRHLLDRVDLYESALREIATRPTVERNPDGDDQAAATMQLIAREAIDFVVEREEES